MTHNHSQHTRHDGSQGSFWTSRVFLVFLGFAAIAVVLYVAVAHHLPNGFFWSQGGYEYPLLWGTVALAFAIRGGGAFSVDRALGRSF